MPLDSFVAGLRTAWQGGEIRPTSQPKLKAKRGRRRLDPLVAVTNDLHSWFDADPSLSGRQLLDRLQAEYPGEYPDGLVRTVQRRLKIWRSAMVAQPRTFMAICSSKWSRKAGSSGGVRLVMPALFTRIEMSPKNSAARAAAA